jgi:serine/threonine-protein kinase RsbW
MPEFLRVARVAASGLASRLGFGLDEVDDLRLALDELCFALIGKGDENGELELTYTLEERSLTISGRTERSSDSDELVIGSLSRQILTALVDEHKVWDDGQSGRFVLVKRQVASNQ